MEKITIPEVGEINVKDLSQFFKSLDSITILWHCNLSDEEHAKLVTHTATTIRAFLRDKIQYTEGLSYMKAPRHIADSDSLEQFDQNTFQHL